MICPNCGSENKDNVNQCIFCGQRLAPKAASQESQSSEQTASENTNEQTPPWQHGETDTPNWQEQPGGQNWQQNNPNWQNQQNSQNWQNQQTGQNWQQNNGWNGQPNWNQQQPWQNRPYNPYPQKQPTNGFAMTSLILGIVGIITACILPYLAIPVTIAAIVFGIIALKKGSGGKGMAIAGITIGGVMLIFSILILVLAVYIISSGTYDDILNDLYKELYDLQGLLFQFKQLWG